MRLWSFWPLTIACLVIGSLMTAAGWIIDNAFLFYTGGGIALGAVAAIIASFGINRLFGTKKSNSFRLL